MDCVVLPATVDDWDGIVALKSKLMGEATPVWHNDVAWRVLYVNGKLAGCFSVAIRDKMLWTGDFCYEKRLGGKAGFHEMVDAIRQEARESGLPFCGVIAATNIEMLRALGKESVLPTFVQVEGC